MIDSSLIKEHLSAADQLLLAHACATIHRLGVLELQAKANTWGVAEGFQERSPEELAKHILQVQQTNRNLLALHEWAGHFDKEIDHA